MRVALIGHTYMLNANRGKLGNIAAACEKFLFIAPDQWPEKDFGPRIFEPTLKLDGAALPCVRAGHVRRFRFRHAGLKKTLADFAPDLIHVEAEAGSAAAFQAAVIARSLRCKITQFCWENIPAASFLRKALLWASFRRIDFLFCGSKGAEEAARADGYRGDAFVVPQVGVDPDAIAKTEARRLFPEGVFTVGVVSRLDAKKGAADVIAALADPSCASARLAIVGDGPERGPLEALARKLRLEERVRFAGAVRHEEVAGYMKGFDVLVLASRDAAGWREQFGHVLIEAMAAGTPVIGSDGGAIPEVIGDAGIVFHQGNATELASAIRALLVDSEARKRYALQGKRRVEALYTDERVAEKMISAWRSILRG